MLQGLGVTSLLAKPFRQCSDQANLGSTMRAIPPHHD
jgi:hypothetical protein